MPYHPLNVATSASESWFVGSLALAATLKTKPKPVVDRELGRTASGYQTHRERMLLLAHHAASQDAATNR